MYDLLRSSPFKPARSTFSSEAKALLEATIFTEIAAARRAALARSRANSCCSPSNAILPSLVDLGDKFWGGRGEREGGRRITHVGFYEHLMTDVSSHADGDM